MAKLSSDDKQFARKNGEVRGKLLFSILDELDEQAQQLAEEKKDFDTLDDQYHRLGEKYEALQWQPITPETEVPAKYEIGGWAEGEFCITECIHGSEGKNLLPVWTFFRPSNPPTPEAADDVRSDH